MATAIDYKELFKSFSSVRIGVIGDMMLDTYWWGNVERISPEAPVPVVTVNKKEYRIGGRAMWHLTWLRSEHLFPFFQ